MSENYVNIAEVRGKLIYFNKYAYIKKGLH